MLLPLSENLSLIYASSAGEGKTKEMAKGLILCHQDDVFAGESAGFGLPVLKTENLTIFPSPVSSKLCEPGIIEAVYHLNLINVWKISGLAAPPCFRRCMEKTVRFYMSRPEFQLSGLKMRNAVFKIMRIRSIMKPGKSYGYCRVLYQAKNLQLKISVKGQSLKDPEQLILLNEVPGIDFTRMITRDKNGGKIFEGEGFLPWQTCTLETALENPGLHIGFFLSLPDHPDPPCSQIAAGREVGRDLNWAGLSLATDQSVFTYHINFYKRKSEGLEK